MSGRKLKLGLIGSGWVSKFYGIGSSELPERCEWARAADLNWSAAEKNLEGEN